MHSVFAGVERQNEKLIAYLRLSIVLVLSVVFMADEALGQNHMFMFSLLGFGLIAASGLALSLGGFFWPWLPWLFATFDVGLLLHCLRVFTVGIGKPFYGALNTSGAMMIFLYLAIGAMRYRPWLVLYTGFLFVAGWVAVWMAADSTGVIPDMPMATTGATDDSGLTGDIARLAIVVLTTLFLFLIAQRSRKLLLVSISEANLRSNLSRYLPRSLATKLARDDQAVRSSRHQKAAVLFGDIREFTSMAEEMAPDEVAKLLNAFRRRVSQAVADRAGVIDKFIGDGVMVVFGMPEPTNDDAGNALACGLAIASSIEEWNLDRKAMERAPIRIGIGIHYGNVLIGALGDEHRLEYTVIGDTVNVAERLQGLTKEFDTEILVSAELLAAAGERENETEWEVLPEQILRGRQAPIRLYKPKRRPDVEVHTPLKIARLPRGFGEIGIPAGAPGGGVAAMTARPHRLERFSHQSGNE